MKDWAAVAKTHTPLSAKRYFPPHEHSLYKDSFATGNALLPQEAVLLSVLTERARRLGTRIAKEIADLVPVSIH